MYTAMLRLASVLVPGAARQDWLTEWSSELWYLRNPTKGNVSGSHARPRPWLFCLGAFQDALWMLRNDPDEVPRRVVWLGSPRRCLSILALLAGASYLAALRLPAARPIHILPNLMLIVIAFVLLPVATSLGLGEYSAANTSGNVRRRLFLATKFAFVIPAVFLGGLVLGSILGDRGIQPQATLIAYVFAFRWIVRDQRQRCPVCLRLLTHPTRIGWISSIFLEWHGTEFICTKGHGLLHVPEIAESSYGVQRWQALDASWRTLF